MEEEKTEVKSEGQDPEVKEEQPSETDDQPKDELEEIKEAYEAKLKKVEEEADKAKKQYETDLAKRNKMIADLIGNETPAPVSDSFEKVIKARETNKRL